MENNFGENVRSNYCFLICSLLCTKPYQVKTTHNKNCFDRLNDIPLENKIYECIFTARKDKVR